MLTDLFTILDARQRGRMRLYLAWLVLYCFFEAATVLILLPLLEALLRGDGVQTRLWLAILAGMTAATCALRYVQRMRGFALSLIVLETLHKRLGDHIVCLPIGWFSTERVGRLSRSATSGTMAATNVFAHLLSPIASGILVPAVMVLAMTVLDWRMGLTALLSVPLIYGANRGAAKAIARTDAVVDKAAATASNRVVEFARTQYTLRAFGRGECGYAPLEAAIAAQRDAAGSMLSQTFPKIMAGGLAVQLAFGALVSVGLWLVLHGAIEPVRLVALLALAARFVGPLAEASARAGLLRIARDEIHRLAEIFAAAPLPEPAHPLEPYETGRVTFENVSFGYHTCKPVLTELSLHVPPHGMMAIVGPSGSGKSTLLKLLMRFFDVNAGSISVGGVDVREQSSTALMAQFAPVLQDVYLFDDTLEANIRLGRPDATQEEWREAARIVGVEEIADRLPAGWATRVGEGGSALSGGERQRVSLARAILKKAPIVILDEATASLDIRNEHLVRKAVEHLRHSSTVIVVAHQLPTIMTADQIVVLDGGRVVERGKHFELLEKNGLYATLWQERHRAQGWRLGMP